MFLIWLKIFTPYKDPALVAGYYYEAISTITRCPKLVRADAGTEWGSSNISIKALWAMAGYVKN